MPKFNFQGIFLITTMLHRVRVLRQRTNREPIHILRVTISTTAPIMFSHKALSTSTWAVCVSTLFNYQRLPTISASARRQCARSPIVMVTMTIITTVLMTVAQNKVRRRPTRPIRRKGNTVIAATMNSLAMAL